MVARIPSLERLQSVHAAALDFPDEELASQSRRALAGAYAVVKRLAEPGGPETLRHSVASALILAEIGLSTELVVLALLHHILDEGMDKYTDEVPLDLYQEAQTVLQEIRSLKELRQHAMSVGLPPGGVYEYGNAKVAEVLEKEPGLIAVLLSSAVDTLLALSKGTSHPPFELQLSTDPKEFAEDVLDYLAPFAHFYHLTSLTWQIEDAVMAIREPTLFTKLERSLPAHTQTRHLLIEALKSRIRHCLTKAFGSRSEFMLQGRSKSIFSIARKLGDSQHPEEALWKLGDYIALRIVIDDPKGLFGLRGAKSLGDASISEVERNSRASMQVLEALAGEFDLNVGQTDDYIHHPTATGYQGLHIGAKIPSAIRRQEGRLFPRLKNMEVQIRTKELHEKAEFGEWAHFKYKLLPRLGQVQQGHTRRDAKREWGQNWAEYFESKIAYRTRSGGLREIERGATYADAAYALVPEGMHPLTVRIENPDFVEQRSHSQLFEPLVPLSRIIVTRTGTPRSVSPAMLSSVRTIKARKALAATPAARKKRTLREQGLEILRREQELRRQWSYSLDDGLASTADALQEASNCTGLRIDSVENLLLAVARGEIDSQRLISEWNRHFTNKVTIKYGEDKRSREAKWQSASALQSAISAGRLRLVSLPSLGIQGCHLQEEIVLADCCGPLPGDHLVGWNMTLPAELRHLCSSRHVSIVHWADCQVPRPKQKKSIKVQGNTWRRGLDAQRIAGHAEFLCYDRPGLLNLITTSINGLDPDANIGDIVARSVYDNSTVIWMEISVRGSDELARILQATQDQLRNYVIDAARWWRPI